MEPVALVDLLFEADAEIGREMNDKPWFKEKHGVIDDPPVIRMEINIIADEGKIEKVIADIESGLRHAFEAIAIAVVDAVGGRIREEAGIVRAEGNEARVERGIKVVMLR